MPYLGDFLGQLMSEIALARMQSDLETVRLAELYAEHPLLRTLPVPHLRLPNVDLEVPVLIQASEPPRADESPRGGVKVSELRRRFDAVLDKEEPRGRRIRPTVFNVDLRVFGSGKGKRWLVDGFTPGVVRALPAGSGPDQLTADERSTAGVDLAPRDRGQARLGAIWLAVPLGVLALAVLIPISFAHRELAEGAPRGARLRARARRALAGSSSSRRPAARARRRRARARPRRAARAAGA